MYDFNLFKRKLINFLQSLILLLSIGVLFLFTSYVLLGELGIVLVIILSVFVIVFIPKYNPNKVIDKYHGYELSYYHAPTLFELVEKLSIKSKIKKPKIFILPTDNIIAFSTGSRENSAIALSEGIFELLNIEEIFGVLGHEISHIKNNDIWLMQFSSIISIIVVHMSMFTALLFYTMSIIFELSYPINVHYLLIFLIFIPIILIIIQFMLSRAREYQADLDATVLTEDVKYLKNALIKINNLQYNNSITYEFLKPYSKKFEYFSFNTHPPLNKRIQQLEVLEEIKKQ